MAEANAKKLAFQNEDIGVAQYIFDVALIFSFFLGPTGSTLLFGAIKNLINGTLSKVNSNWTATLANLDWKTEIKRLLFCKIVQNNGVFSNSVWLSWVSDIPITEEDSQLAAMQQEVINVIGAFNSQVTITAYETFALNSNNTCAALWEDCLPGEELECDENIFIEPNIQELTGSGFFTGFGYPAIFDGNKTGTNRWVSDNNTSPHFVTVQLIGAYQLQAIEVTCSNFTNESPSAIQVHASINGSTWDEVGFFTGLSWGANESKNFNLTTSQSYTYYRFTFIATSSGWCSITEIAGC